MHSLACCIPAAFAFALVQDLLHTSGHVHVRAAYKTGTASLCDASTRLDCDACPRDASTTAPRRRLFALTTALAFAPPLRFPCDASDTRPRSLLSATALQHAREASEMPLRTRLQLLSD